MWLNGQMMGGERKTEWMEGGSENMNEGGVFSFYGNAPAVLRGPKRWGCKKNLRSRETRKELQFLPWPLGAKDEF